MFNFPRFPVYPITRARPGKPEDHVRLVRSFLSVGVPFLQVREKAASDRQMLSVLLEIQQLCHASKCLVIVNDRVDLALASGADGVHVGQDDLSVPVVRRLLGKDAVIGLSTHTLRQFEEAQPMDLDYVAVGPVFPTATKETGYEPLGEELIGDLTSRSRHPVVAIGGIKLQNVRGLWNQGIHSAAIISDIVEHPDPVRRLKDYLELWK